MSEAKVFIKATQAQVLEVVQGFELEARGDYVVVSGKHLEPGSLVDAWYTSSKSPLVKLAAELSSKISGPMLAMLNWENDLLRLWVYSDGKLLSEYDSNPSYATCTVTKPELEHPEAFAQAFGVPERSEAISKLLARKRGLGFMNETGRFQLLAKELGIPLEFNSTVEGSSLIN
jgi:hypothetical protein